MSQSLLPPNSTPAERAIEGLSSHVRDLPVPIRDLWNPATCPAAFLPWLAWAFSVDTWRSEWSEATKRAVIAASPRVHRLKGTVAAVRAAVEAFGVPARVIEWFSAEGQAADLQPYTAVVEALLTKVTPEPGAALLADLLASAEAAAPARVHLLVRLASTGAAGVARIAHVRRPVTVARFTAEVAA